MWMKEGIYMRSKLPHFLADTWWYALTNRLNDNDYLKLVKKKCI